MQGKFLFLGSGSSMGIPVIGCTCSVCTSKNPKNRRLRPSGLITLEDKKILIDAGPDYREQALKHKIDHIDGLLLTHTHFDHLAGLDELRIYFLRNKNEVPCLLSKESFKDLKDRYYYLFQKMGVSANIAAQFSFQILEEHFGSTNFLGHKIGYVSYHQGGMKVNGFRFGGFAYISDICDYSEEIFDELDGVETLVVSALRKSHSPVHFTVDEAVNFSQKIGAKKTYFTHIAHELDHDLINEELPEDIELGYDGLEVTFTMDQ